MLPENQLRKANQKLQKKPRHLLHRGSVKQFPPGAVPAARKVHLQNIHQPVPIQEQHPEAGEERQQEKAQGENLQVLQHQPEGRRTLPPPGGKALRCRSR